MILFDKLPPTIQQLFWFTLVGGIGFIVDAGVLQAGLIVGLGFYAGRVVSYLCAATTTWALNRRWTFKTATSANKKREWGRFLALNTIGGAVNYGVYVLTLQHLRQWMTERPPFLRLGRVSRRPSCQFRGQ